MELPLEVDCQSVKGLLEERTDFHFLDCRESDEYQTAKIPGAALLPMSELLQRIEEIEEYKNRRVVVHCHHGGRSLRVAKWLRQQGFSQAQSMAGGIDEWATKIDPTVPRY